MRGSRGTRTAVVILLCIGISSAAGAGIAWCMDYRFAASARRADGRVVELQLRRTRKGGRSYAPVVAYDVDGRTWRHASGTSSSPPAFDIGEHVVVLYDPADPSRARIDSFVARRLLPAVFGGLGALSCAIGMVLMIRGRRG